MARVATATIVAYLIIAGLLVIGLLSLSRRPSHSVAAAPASLFASPLGTSTACSQPSPCSLQTAVSQAVDGATVYASGGTYVGSGGAVITITKSITLNGGWDGGASGPIVLDSSAHPTTLDGESQRRGVGVDGGITVTLEGFTVANGVHDLQGAGLYAQDASLTLRSMTFASNAISTTVTGSPYGGGAVVDGGTLLVESSTFRGNAVWASRQPMGGWPGDLQHDLRAGDGQPL